MTTPLLLLLFFSFLFSIFSNSILFSFFHTLIYFSFIHSFPFIALSYYFFHLSLYFSLTTAPLSLVYYSVAPFLFSLFSVLFLILFSFFILSQPLSLLLFLDFSHSHVFSFQPSRYFNRFFSTTPHPHFIICSS